MNFTPYCDDSILLNVKSEEFESNNSKTTPWQTIEEAARRLGRLSYRFAGFDRRQRQVTLTVMYNFIIHRLHPLLVK